MGIPANDLGVSRHLVPVDSITRTIGKRQAMGKPVDQQHLHVDGEDPAWRSR
jgi:hypothetical protein